MTVSNPIPEVDALQAVEDHHEVLPLGRRPRGLHPVVGLEDGGHVGLLVGPDPHAAVVEERLASSHEQHVGVQGRLVQLIVNSKG